MGFNWTCPYCNSKTTVNPGNYSSTNSDLTIANTDGFRRLRTLWIVCPNADCTKLTLSVELFELVADVMWKSGSLIKEWRLLPDSNAKIFPDYIPKQLLQDYHEAHSIVELSPKASATLSRRCLQGIIRDFWQVDKPTLFAEINAIKDNVDPLIWESINAVRKVGNIGAHMEKDIDIIVDVDPGEAALLIQLIEMLFTEWYINKHERELRMKSIIEIAAKKEILKKPAD